MVNNNILIINIFFKYFMKSLKRHFVNFMQTNQLNSFSMQYYEISYIALNNLCLNNYSLNFQEIFTPTLSHIKC